MSTVVKLTGKETNCYLIDSLLDELVKWEGFSESEKQIFLHRKMGLSFSKIAKSLDYHPTTLRNKMRLSAIRFLKEEKGITANVFIRESPGSSPVTQEVLNIVNSTIDEGLTLNDVIKALRKYKFCKQAVSNLISYREKPVEFFQDIDIADMLMLTIHDLQIRTGRSMAELKELLQYYTASEIAANRELYQLYKSPNYCSEESSMQ